MESKFKILAENIRRIHLLASEEYGAIESEYISLSEGNDAGIEKDSENYDLMLFELNHALEMVGDTLGSLSEAMDSLHDAEKLRVMVV